MDTMIGGSVASDAFHIHNNLQPVAKCDCTEQELAPLVALHRDFPHLTAHVHECRCVENAIVPGEDTLDMCHEHVCREWKRTAVEWIRETGATWRMSAPFFLKPQNEGVSRLRPVGPLDCARLRFSLLRAPVAVDVSALMVEKDGCPTHFDTRNTGIFIVPFYLMQWLGGADECTAVRVLSQCREDTVQPDWSTLPDGAKREIMVHVRAYPPPHREEDSLKRRLMQEELANPKLAKTDEAIGACIENEGRTS